MNSDVHLKWEGYVASCAIWSNSDTILWHYKSTSVEHEYNNSEETQKEWIAAQLIWRFLLFLFQFFQSKSLSHTEEEEEEEEE